MESSSRLDLPMHTFNRNEGKGTFERLLRIEGSTFLVLCGEGIVGAKVC